MEEKGETPDGGMFMKRVLSELLDQERGNSGGKDRNG